MNRMIAILIAITMTAPILSAQEMELVGKVLEVEEIATAEGDVNIIQVQVQTQNREMVRARLGPVWMTQNDVQIGDEITCRGKCGRPESNTA